MSKVALYLRISTSGQTLENQRIRLIEYAKKNNLEYDIFEEVMSTRKTRPVKQHLLNKIRNGEYTGVVVYKLDRWARSSTELVLDTQWLISNGYTFVSLSDNLDFSSAAGKLQFQILSAFAEFERELIRERTIEGLRRARMQNKRIGRPPGVKDSTKRAKSGYYLREAKKRQIQDEQKGIFKPIEEYFTKKPYPKNQATQKTPVTSPVIEG